MNDVLSTEDKCSLICSTSLLRPACLHVSTELTNNNNNKHLLYLVEVLETFICEGDGDGEDGVGGVLVKASFTVPSEQSQGPAPKDTAMNGGPFQKQDSRGEILALP